MAGLLSRALDRFSPERVETGEPQPDGSPDGAPAECRLIADVPERSIVSIHGVLTSVAERPIGGGTALQAELDDGSDCVTLVWLGRRQLGGVLPGRSLTAHGRLGCNDGVKVLYNPRYELDA